MESQILSSNKENPNKLEPIIEIEFNPTPIIKIQLNPEQNKG